MYESYFGLTERPFSIAPDPQYLYMSSRHKEAMAHLSYGLSQGGCFIVLTGEVGTGKTTLCRNLLGELPDNVDIALILNANINEQELLQTICDELGISYQQEQSQKQLLDLINQHLLSAFSEGQQTVLIIDEAQLLSRDVLEKIRLLTNLETNKAKLLQIILIGQPELNDLLARNDLRQLAQRVTARYHLDALRAKEIEDYVNFRLSVAGCKKPIFTGQALTQLHKLTEGIPRKINVLADHSLLAAYAQNESVVSAKTVKAASKDVFIEHMPSRQRTSSLSSYKRWALPALLAIAVNIALWWLFVGQNPPADGANERAQDRVENRVEPAADSVVESRPIDNRADNSLRPDSSVQSAQETALSTEPTISQVARTNDIETGQNTTDSTVVQSAVAQTQDPQTQGQPATTNNSVDQNKASSGSVMIADEFLDFSPEVSEKTLQSASNYRPPGAPPVTTNREAPVASRGAAPASNFEGELGRVLETSADLTGRIKAFRDLVSLWGQQLPDQLLGPICESVLSLRLECQSFDDWAELVRLNRPAIMVVAHNNSLHRVIVREIIGDEVELLVGGSRIRVPTQELLARWNRNGVALWQPGEIGSQFLQLGDSSPRLPAVRARLDAALARLAMPTLDSIRSRDFDLDLSQKVFTLQTRFDIIGDSKIGIETYILLNELLNPESVLKLRTRP